MNLNILHQKKTKEKENTKLLEGILKDKSQNNNVNNLIKQLNKENDNLSNEIDNFFN